VTRLGSSVQLRISPIVNTPIGHPERSRATLVVQGSKSAGAWLSASSSKPAWHRAGESGGARTGRHMQARIADVVSGGWIVARTRIGPRQRGHSSTSIAKTRFISSAHASRLALAASGWCGELAWVGGIAGGVASNSRSRIEPSISIEAESGVAADAALAGSPSTHDGVEAEEHSQSKRASGPITGSMSIPGCAREPTDIAFYATYPTLNFLCA